MKTRDRIIVGVAWANFLLGLAGVLKFIPLTLVAVKSALVANSSIAWRWSLDLVSDTHWIFLVWVLVLLALQIVSGQRIVFPWRFRIT